MKILFSPSESKSEYSNLTPINKDSFIFKELFEARLKALNLYKNFIDNAGYDELSLIFGLKDKSEIDKFKTDIFKQKTIEAIKRYDGTAFEYLDFKNLNTQAQDYILNNTLIFSNLFGVIKASDTIPYYKLKQGFKFADFDLASFYKKNFSQAIDEYLKDDEVIDLRAGFYEKFYTLKQEFVSYKFLKNGKIVSHFAKAYRGVLLKTLASYNCQTNQDLLDNLPKELKVCELKIQNFKKEITIEIVL